MTRTLFSTGWTLASMLGLAGALLFGTAAAADDQAAVVAAATVQAEQWLGELDSHRYAENWEQTAEVLKQKFSEEAWTREVGRPRELLGRVLIREQKQADYSTLVPGGQPGKYVMVVYLTQFANTTPVLEKVLVKLDDDGRWRIAGYDIARPPGAAAASGSPARPSTKE